VLVSCLLAGGPISLTPPASHFTFRDRLLFNLLNPRLVRFGVVRIEDVASGCAVPSLVTVLPLLAERVLPTCCAK